MQHKLLTGIIMGATLHVASMAGAQIQVDVMRCESKVLRNESRYYGCQATCDRKLSAQSNPTADAALAVDTACHTVCDARHTRRQHRIQTTPPCRTIYNTPDAMECEALSLSLQADYVICQLRCSNRPQSDDCMKACTSSCTSESQNLQSLPVCSLGRVTATPLCD
jgi:hypothetical protein